MNGGFSPLSWSVLGGRAGPSPRMGGSNNAATFRHQIPTSRVWNRRGPSDHWREEEVPMRRLTAGIPAKRARCVAEIRPSRPWERLFWPSFPHVREVLSAPFASRTGSLTWGLSSEFHQRSGHGGFTSTPAFAKRLYFRRSLTSGTDLGDVLPKKSARFPEFPAVKSFVGTSSFSP